MPEFNWGAGFAKAGEAIADTAGKYTLEAQRANLQQEGIKLADELAGVREEKQRGFLSSERVAGQEFQSGEKKLDREQTMQITKMQMDNAVKTAQISAGPGYARVALEREQFTAGAPLRDAQLQGVKADTDLKQKTAAGYEEDHKAIVAQREAQTKAYSAETLLKGIQADAAKSVFDAKNELAEAVKTKDAAAIAAAEKKLHIANMGANDGQQQVSAALAEAKLWETAFKETQQRLVIMQDPTKTMAPGGEKLIAALEKQYAEQVRAFNAAAKQAAELRRRYQTGYTPEDGAVTGAPAGVDINDVLFGKKKEPEKKPGVINNAPQKSPSFGVSP